MKRVYYGWIMVGLSVLGLIVFASVVYTFGVFVKPLTLEFNWERGALSLAVTLRNLTMGVLGLITGRLCDRYGPRFLVTTAGILIGAGFFLMSRIDSIWQVYLIYTFLLGVGGSCTYLPVVATISRWFVQKRGLAVGIASAGFTVGGIAAPIIAQWLISSQSWQQAYIVFGITNLVVLLGVAQFMKHSPQKIGLKPLGEETIAAAKHSSSGTPTIGGLTFTQAIKTESFWILSIIIFCFTFSFDVMLAHLVPHAIDINIPEMVAATLVSVIAALAIAGKIAAGFVIDRIRTRKTLVGCLAILTLALIWLVLAKELWLLYLFAVVFGFAYGGIITVQNFAPVELFGIRHVGAILSGIMLIGEIGGALGAPVAGYIFDATGTYRVAFIICLILSAVALVSSLILLRHNQERKLAWTR